MWLWWRGNSSEVLHLPAIVDIAESSPTACAAAAAALRKHLDPKHNATHPHKQYNAIMIMRILSDNPGPTFTRNLADPKFTAAVKDLLRRGMDPSVRQILGETLEYWEGAKSADEGLAPLREIWRKEKRSLNYAASLAHGGDAAVPNAPETHRSSRPRHQSGHDSYQGHQGLPSMLELTARISEARTSASLLEQVLQSTPPAEVSTNELVKEFADRCRTATRSIVNYIQATEDEDTMTTLIETNDLLGLALERYTALATAAPTPTPAPVPEQARIVDVGGDDPWSAYAAEHADRAEDVPARTGSAAAGAGGNQVRRRTPPPPPRAESPVSPISPDPPVNYRY
ncbi:GAT-like domain-containing protein [Morchella conica CCBAS932]|uniref:GAT-like domain-containing protein n=1 Tax=Morchella conica CCBAS932 TaxID=1392247 RepID=A0A3N4KUN2_9PEZI|nr:GAT-like domain-containing protein [Morchella conica CCBAS932]